MVEAVVPVGEVVRVLPCRPVSVVLAEPEASRRGRAAWVAVVVPVPLLHRYGVLVDVCGDVLFYVCLCGLDAPGPRYRCGMLPATRPASIFRLLC